MATDLNDSRDTVIEHEMIIARALLRTISEVDPRMGDSKTVRGQLDHLACATSFLTNWSGIAKEEMQEVP